MSNDKNPEIIVTHDFEVGDLWEDETCPKCHHAIKVSDMRAVFLGIVLVTCDNENCKFEYGIPILYSGVFNK
jgi:hypothetical protein